MKAVDVEDVWSTIRRLDRLIDHYSSVSISGTILDALLDDLEGIRRDLVQVASSYVLRLD